MAENLATFRAAGQCRELIRGANLPPARAWFLSANPRESGSYPGWIGVDGFVGEPVIDAHSRDRAAKTDTAIRNRSRWSRPQSGRPSQGRRQLPGRIRKADLVGVAHQV